MQLKDTHPSVPSNHLHTHRLLLLSSEAWTGLQVLQKDMMSLDYINQPLDHNHQSSAVISGTQGHLKLALPTSIRENKSLSLWLLDTHLKNKTVLGRVFFFPWPCSIPSSDPSHAGQVSNQVLKRPLSPDLFRTCSYKNTVRVPVHPGDAPALCQCNFSEIRLHAYSLQKQTKWI